MMEPLHVIYLAVLTTRPARLIPLEALKFPSIVVASDNDHVVSLQRATDFAHRWGSQLVVVRNAGHFLPKDGYDTWPQGLSLLQRLTYIPF